MLKAKNENLNVKKKIKSMNMKITKPKVLNGINEKRSEIYQN